MVKSRLFPLAFGAVAIATPAAANHPFHLDEPFPSRGACEAQTQSLSNDDDWLLDTFPNVFSSHGEVRSFLNRAFTCDRDSSDGQWYITDHREEVLSSDWYLRRQ
jgi:hypothetical protein